MDIHYNAFISYRHHPDDIRVASQIHRLLEHYRVPRALRKQSKQINRLFRDKEELPITSNLTEDITRALNNSDFLIVICSTHTRESTWVQREIETFLKTHDRSRVLTVLVNGEPYDTIPEILLHEERVNQETGEKERTDIEPLSCDWRLPQRQAKREELPRLAAALMGCGYDELRRRERQYRTRRLIAGCTASLAAMACITGYVIYNSMLISNANKQLEQANTDLNNANISLEQANDEILANYNEALINQSQYLASSAERLLDEGDRLAAISLALEALPGYGGQRPYEASAEYALGKAVGIYERGTSLKAAGAFQCDELISSFYLSWDGTVLYTLDARDVLTAWDTTTFRKTGSTTPAVEPEKMLVTEDGDLLIMESGEGLACYGKDGQMLWSLAASIHDMAFLDDRNTVLVQQREILHNQTFYCLDARNGQMLGEPVVCASNDYLTFLQEVYSSSAPILMRSLEYPNYYLRMMDLETGSVAPVGDAYVSATNTCVTVEGNIAVLGQKTQNSGWQGIIMDVIITTPEVLVVQCFRGTDGTQLWETEITTYISGACQTLEEIPGREMILFQSGNVYAALDSATGEIRSMSESTSYALWVEAGAERARMVLADGTMGVFYYDESRCGILPSVKEDLVSARLVGSDVYVADFLGTQVVCYRYMDDDNWVSMGEEGYEYSNEWHTFGNSVFLESYKSIQMLDTAAGCLRWTIPLSGAEIICVSSDGTSLWARADHGQTLVKVDVATGTYTQWTLPREVEGISPYTGETTWLSTSHIYRDGIVDGGRFYYPVSCYSDNHVYLYSFDPVSQAGEYWKVFNWAEDYSGYSYSRLVAVSGNWALLWNITDSTLLEFSLTTETGRVVAENVALIPAYLPQEDGSYLLGISGEILRRKWGQDGARFCSLPGCSVVSMHRFDEYLLALGDDGYLYRFDESGNQLSKSSITRYNTFSSSISSSDFEASMITWDRSTDGDLILSLCRAGNLIDCDSWKTRAWLPNCYAYLPDKNGVLMRDSVNEYGMGYYPLYSLEDVEAMALEALNGYELSETLRQAYGLD